MKEERKEEEKTEGGMEERRKEKMTVNYIKNAILQQYNNLYFNLMHIIFVRVTSEKQNQYNIYIYKDIYCKGFTYIIIRAG